MKFCSSFHPHSLIILLWHEAQLHTVSNFKEWNDSKKLLPVSKVWMLCCDRQCLPLSFVTRQDIAYLCGLCRQGFIFFFIFVVCIQTNVSTMLCSHNLIPQQFLLCGGRGVVYSVIPSVDLLMGPDVSSSHIPFGRPITWSKQWLAKLDTFWFRCNTTGGSCDINPKQHIDHVRQFTPFLL